MPKKRNNHHPTTKNRIFSIPSPIAITTTPKNKPQTSQVAVRHNLQPDRSSLPTNSARYTKPRASPLPPPPVANPSNKPQPIQPQPQPFPAYPSQHPNPYPPAHLPRLSHPMTYPSNPQNKTKTHRPRAARRIANPCVENKIPPFRLVKSHLNISPPIVRLGPSWVWQGLSGGRGVEWFMSVFLFSMGPFGLKISDAMVRVRRGLRRRRRDIIPYLEKRPCKFPARTWLHLASHSCLSAGRESGDGDETPQEPWRHNSKKPKAHHPPPSQPVARRHRPVACAPVYFSVVA